MGELVKVVERKDWHRVQGLQLGPRAEGCGVQCHGTFYAIGDACTHRGGPLSEGDVSGTTVTCPWHKAQYDLKTGGVLTPPALQGVASYKVVVEGDDVSIEL